MAEIINPRILRVILLLLAVRIVSLPAQAAVGVSTYIFAPEQSTIVQTDGIAGVHRTYVIEGQFQLSVDPNAGTAFFAHVDANAVDDSEFRHSLDPNEVFNMTELAGTILEDGSIRFEGVVDDTSEVLITLTFEADCVHLIGETIPPAGSADFFVFNMDAVAQRRYAGGTGEPNDPYLIYTPEQMNTIGLHEEDWDKHFKLMADIDLKTYIGTDFHIIGYNESFYIDSPNNVPFTGTFDGNHHSICNFTYRSTPSRAQSIGLFAFIDDPNAKIINLTLENPMVAAVRGASVGTMVGILRKGSLHNCRAIGGWVFGDLDGQGRDRLVSDRYGTGGLVGENGGTMSCCHTSVSVEGAAFNGGLVAGNSGTITGCSSTGSVEGINYTGGLVVDNYGLISNSFASGPVNGDYTTGGLVALCSEGVISNCYATSSVKAGARTGGLVGYSIKAEILSCYAAGPIEGGLQTGGLVGRNQESAIERSFWDRQATHQSSGAGTGSSTGAIGVDTLELYSMCTFLDAGWDFIGETDNGTEDIWWIDEGQGYPILSWELPQKTTPQH